MKDLVFSYGNINKTNAIKKLCRSYFYQYSITGNAGKQISMTTQS